MFDRRQEPELSAAEAEAILRGLAGQGNAEGIGLFLHAQIEAQGLQETVIVLVRKADLLQGTGRHRHQEAVAPLGNRGEKNDAVGIDQQYRIAVLHQRRFKIIQTDLSSNSFCFQAVSKFPVKKGTLFKKKNQIILQFKTLFLAKAVFVG